MEPTSTSLGTGDILGSVGVGRRARPRREAIRSPRPRQGYRGEVRRARLLNPHSYACWPWPVPACCRYMFKAMEKAGYVHLFRKKTVRLTWGHTGKSGF